MKILFLGDASMAHYNLSLGLRELGHETLVISEKLRWRKFPQDILLDRKPGKWGGIWYLIQVLLLLPKLRGYDIVQLVGPNFMTLRKEKLRWIYDYLRRHNKRVVMTALGDDYYWVHGCCDLNLFRYSDFNLGSTDRRLTFPYAKKQYEDWTLPLNRDFNEYIARTCDAITPVLYEYWLCYQQYWKDKSTYMPLPIVPKQESADRFRVGDKIRIFLGIQRNRSEYKGTDIMRKAAEDIAAKYPNKVELTIVENLPYTEYIQKMESQDVLIDQLYSYTPAMNGLLALSKGIVCVGGGEPEMYQLLNETERHPIVNVKPYYESVYGELENLVLHPERIPELKRQSYEFAQQHHHYIKVAQRYQELYNSLLKEDSKEISPV